MDKADAVRIIRHAVECTQWRCNQFDKSWRDIDRIFIHHGYEQQGFEIFKFLPLLEKRGCYSIEALGTIHLEKDGSKYDRRYAGSLSSPFYAALRSGERGETGRSLHDAIIEFQQPGAGRAGRTFWQLIWRLLVSCRYLRTNHQASFRRYILDAFSKFARKSTITDEEFLSTSPEDWSIFLEEEPWELLKGIGSNTWDFIFGDIVEARFAQDSYKLDSANMHFLRVTGIADLIGDMDRRRVIPFIRELEMGYTLREINKAIYVYCSVTERDKFGFCRALSDCNRCAVNTICDMRVT